MSPIPDVPESRVWERRWQRGWALVFALVPVFFAVVTVACASFALRGERDFPATTLVCAIGLVASSALVVWLARRAHPLRRVLASPERVVWIWVQSMRSRSGLRSIWSVFVATDGGEIRWMEAPNEADARRALEALRVAIPRVVVGHTAERWAAYGRDPRSVR